jgi:alkylation response protein AidB-like acyl-CoA dehydrogenase
LMESHHSVERVRELARAETVLEPERWREAAELGWTTLLVPVAAGGGSISGNGLADLLIVASLFGQHAAPGPLISTNVVAAALGRWGSAEHHDGPLAAMLTGDGVATWGHRSACTAATSDDGVTITGRVRSLECATAASHVLLDADEAGGRSHFLVPLDAPGIAFTALAGVDLTRRFWDLTLDRVVVAPAARVGEPGTATVHHEELIDIAAVLALGEMAGALHRAFAMTLEWVTNRYSFGRPLSSYQEIKHRMADLRTQLEAAEAVAARAASAVGTGTGTGTGSGSSGGRAWASAGMAHVGRHVPEAVQDCIQLHGGIGVTNDCDLHLFLRRVALDANVYGSPAQFARRLGAMVVAEGAQGDAA